MLWESGSSTTTEGCDVEKSERATLVANVAIPLHGAISGLRVKHFSFWQLISKSTTFNYNHYWIFLSSKLPPVRQLNYKRHLKLWAMTEVSQVCCVCQLTATSNFCIHTIVLTSPNVFPPWIVLSSAEKKVKIINHLSILGCTRFFVYFSDLHQTQGLSTSLLKIPLLCNQTATAIMFL